MHVAVALEGPHAEVHVPPRVQDVDLGRVVGRDVVDGEVVGAAREQRRLLPRPVVQDAVDRDALPFEARDVGGRFLSARVVGALLRPGRQRENEGCQQECG